MYLSAAQALPPIPLPSCWLLDSLREWEANRAKAEHFFKNSSKPRQLLQHKVLCLLIVVLTQSLSSTVGIFTGFRPGLMWAGFAGACGLLAVGGLAFGGLAVCAAMAGNGGGGSASRVNVELFLRFIEPDTVVLGPPTAPSDSEQPACKTLN